MTRCWRSSISSRAPAGPAADEDLIGRGVVERAIDEIDTVAGAAQDLDPGRAREQSLDVAVVDGLDVDAVAQQERVLGGIGFVGRIRIPDPLDAAKRTGPVVTGVKLRPFAERFADVIGREQGGAARARVRERRRRDGGEIGARRHVGDRVVHEHRVELAREAQRPHVARQVLAIRVERLRQRQHPGREVGQRAAKVALHEAGVAAGAGAQLQQRSAARRARAFQRGDVRGRLVRVIGDRIEQAVPRCQLPVQQRFHAPKASARSAVCSARSRVQSRA